MQCSSTVDQVVSAFFFFFRELWAIREPTNVRFQCVVDNIRIVVQMSRFPYQVLHSLILVYRTDTKNKKLTKQWRSCMTVTLISRSEPLFVLSRIVDSLRPVQLGFWVEPELNTGE